MKKLVQKQELNRKIKKITKGLKVGVWSSVIGLLQGCANPPPTIAGALDQWNHWDVLVVGSSLFETWKARQMPSWNIQVRRIMENASQEMEVIEIQATENPWVMYHANAGMQTLKEGSRKWCAQFYEKEELRTFEEGWTPMILGGSYWARGRVVCSKWNALKKDWEAQKITQPYPLDEEKNDPKMKEKKEHRQTQSSSEEDQLSEEKDVRRQTIITKKM